MLSIFHTIFILLMYCTIMFYNFLYVTYLSLEIITFRLAFRPL